MEASVRDQTHDLEAGLPHPEPTTEHPSDEELRGYAFDGTSPHGHPA